MTKGRIALALILIVCATDSPVFSQNTHVVTLSGDPAQFEKWLDGMFAPYLRQSAEPSAAFILVKDGHVFFEKGYGFADFRSRTPVLPERTLALCMIPYLLYWGLLGFWF